jgi:predicted nucleic acid binding AN1-type Zn finger protein
MVRNNKSICKHDTCKKRIRPVDTLIASCKCGKQFCSVHRLPESHNCDYNFKNININDEINKLKCISERVDKL